LQPLVILVLTSGLETSWGHYGTGTTQAELAFPRHFQRRGGVTPGLGGNFKPLRKQQGGFWTGKHPKKEAFIRNQLLELVCPKGLEPQAGFLKVPNCFKRVQLGFTQLLNRGFFSHPIGMASLGGGFPPNRERRPSFGATPLVSETVSPTRRLRSSLLSNNNVWSGRPLKARCEDFAAPLT